MKKNNKAFIIGTVATSLLGLTSSGAFATWGPARTTYTMSNPADHAVFNSIIDNPTIGDERDFVRIAEINSETTDYSNSVEVVPGKQYSVWIYFHNDASETYNDEEHGYVGIATGAKLVSNFPTVLTAGSDQVVEAGITADNTDPGFVWDDATLTTTYKKVLLSYVSGSAKLYNDVMDGTVLPDTLFGEVKSGNGTFIGYNSLNGGVPGCEQYHGVVQYVLDAKELEGTVDKTVSKDGNNFTEEVEINPGEEVTFKLTIKNTGDKELTNAVIKDTLPSGLTLVPGSVQRWANESTTKETISDDIVSNGINLGTIGTGNTVNITFRAKAGDDFDCDGINMTNSAKFTYDSETSTGDSDEDTAKVKIKKDDCEPEPTPEPDCSETPDAPECKIPETGPVEIVMAVAVALGIGGGAFYLYRTKKSLKTIENTAVGKDAMDAPVNEMNTEAKKPEEPKANQQ